MILPTVDRGEDHCVMALISAAKQPSSQGPLSEVERGPWEQDWLRRRLECTKFGLGLECQNSFFGFELLGKDKSGLPSAGVFPVDSLNKWGFEPGLQGTGAKTSDDWSVKSWYATVSQLPMFRAGVRWGGVAAEYANKCRVFCSYYLTFSLYCSA